MRLDTYTVRARLLPALITALPLASALAAALAEVARWWSATLGLAMLTASAYFLTQVARDVGKRREPELFERWGGRPTTIQLRHTGPTNPTTLARRHQKLSGLVPELEFPTAGEEAADPVQADEAYDSAVEFLLAQTRDRDKYPLVFEENCNYGFRRNLWALKPWGIAVAIVGLSAGAATAWIAIMSSVDMILGPALAASAVSAIALVGWVTIVNDAWVRHGGDAYAGALLGAIDRL